MLPCDAQNPLQTADTKCVQGSNVPSAWHPGFRAMQKCGTHTARYTTAFVVAYRFLLIKKGVIIWEELCWLNISVFFYVDLKADSSGSGSFRIEGMLDGLRGNQPAVSGIVKLTDLEGSSLGGILEALDVE